MAKTSWTLLLDVQTVCIYELSIFFIDAHRGGGGGGHLMYPLYKNAIKHDPPDFLITPSTPSKEFAKKNLRTPPLLGFQLLSIYGFFYWVNILSRKTFLINLFQLLPITVGKAEITFCILRRCPTAINFHLKDETNWWLLSLHECRARNCLF